jgi:hypothetical protein
MGASALAGTQTGSGHHRHACRCTENYRVRLTKIEGELGYLLRGDSGTPASFPMQEGSRAIGYG